MNGLSFEVVFVNALTDVVNTHILPLVSESDSSEGEDNSGHRRSRSARLRLSEDSFITAIPSLTHLDLSSTRVSPELLDGLTGSSGLRLQSLSLACCVRLT